MSDAPFYAPNRRPSAPRQPVAGELLFEFVRERDHVRFRCELRDHGDYGVEAQFLWNEELFMARTFAPWLDPTRTPRAMAIAWADEERKAIVNE